MMETTVCFDSCGEASNVRFFTFELKITAFLARVEYQFFILFKIKRALLGLKGNTWAII